MTHEWSQKITDRRPHRPTFSSTRRSLRFENLSLIRLCWKYSLWYFLQVVSSTVQWPSHCLKYLYLGRSKTLNQPLYSLFVFFQFIVTFRGISFTFDLWNRSSDVFKSSTLGKVKTFNHHLYYSFFTLNCSISHSSIKFDSVVWERDSVPLDHRLILDG